MRPDLHIASFAGISAGIDVVLFRISILISCISFADAAGGIFGHGMCMWCSVGAGSLRGGDLGLVVTCGICSLPLLGELYGVLL